MDQQQIAEKMRRVEELTELVSSGQMSIEALAAEIGSPISVSNERCGLLRGIVERVFANSTCEFHIVETVCGKCRLVLTRC